MCLKTVEDTPCHANERHETMLDPQPKSMGINMPRGPTMYKKRNGNNQTQTLWGAVLPPRHIRCQSHPVATPHAPAPFPASASPPASAPAPSPASTPAPPPASPPAWPPASASVPGSSSAPPRRLPARVLLLMICRGLEQQQEPRQWDEGQGNRAMPMRAMSADSNPTRLAWLTQTLTEADHQPHQGPRPRGLGRLGPAAIQGTTNRSRSGTSPPPGPGLGGGGQVPGPALPPLNPGHDN